MAHNDCKSIFKRILWMYTGLAMKHFYQNLNNLFACELKVEAGEQQTHILDDYFFQNDTPSAILGSVCQ